MFLNFLRSALTSLAMCKESTADALHIIGAVHVRKSMIDCDDLSQADCGVSGAMAVESVILRSQRQELLGIADCLLCQVSHFER